MILRHHCSVHSSKIQHFNTREYQTELSYYRPQSWTVSYQKLCLIWSFLRGSLFTRAESASKLGTILQQRQTNTCHTSKNSHRISRTDGSMFAGMNSPLSPSNPKAPKLVSIQSVGLLNSQCFHFHTPKASWCHKWAWSLHLQGWYYQQISA